MDTVSLLPAGRRLLSRLMMEDQPVLERHQEIKSSILNITLIAIGIVARVPYAYPAMQLVQGNHIYENLIGAATVICWGSLSAWALINIAYLKFRPLNELEKKATFKRGCCSATISNIAFFIFGVCAQIPTSGIAYYYTSELYWVIIMLIADAGIPMYSMQLAYNKAKAENAKCTGTKLEKLKIAKQKAKVLKRLKIAKLLFLNATLDQRNAVCTQFRNSMVESQGTHVIQSILDLSPFEDNEPGKFYKAGQASFFTLGLVLSIFRMIWKGKLSYYAGEQLHNDVFTIATVIAISILPSAYLNFKMSAEGFKEIYDRFFSLCRKTATRSITEIRPKSAATLKFVASSICAVGMAAIWEVINDYADAQSVFGKILVATVIPPMYIMTATSTFDFVNWMVETYLKWMGNSNEKSFVKLAQRLDRLIALVPDMNDETLSELLEALPIEDGLDNEENKGKCCV